MFKQTVLLMASTLRTLVVAFFANGSMWMLVGAQTPALFPGAIDIDGNGRHAIVMRNTKDISAQAPQLQIGRLIGNQFLFSPLDDPGANFRLVAIADLDSNGKSDLVFIDTTQFPVADVKIWPDFQRANERLWRTVKPGWDVQAIGDFDGDGKAEITWRYLAPDPRDTGVSYIWFNNGTNAPVVRKRGGAPIAVPTDWTLLGAGDFNRDGAADLVYVSPQNQIRVLMATALRTCANYVVATIPQGFVALKVVNVRGDGRGEIFIRNISTGQNQLISIDATGIILPPFAGNPDDPNASCTATSQAIPSNVTSLPNADPAWTFYAAGDFDGDGRTDIVWQRADDTLTLWLATSNIAQPNVVDNAGLAPVGFEVVQSGDAGATARYAVNVTNGYSLGKFSPGQMVHIWSAVAPLTQTVLRWSGDAATLLLEPNEWRTSFIMPKRNVSVTANILTAPVTLQLVSFNGSTARPKRVYYYFPPNMRGVILFSHGSGGSAAFITNTETVPLVSAAVQQGFGVIGTEAEEAVAGDLNRDGFIRWDTTISTSNTDLNNLNLLLASFERQGFISAGTPRYAVGMSQGGFFSITLGALESLGATRAFPQLRFAAVNSYCAKGNAAVVEVTTTPSAWFMCANDDNDQVVNADAQTNFNTLRNRGIAARFDLHPASPLYDLRFVRVNGISLATSVSLANELRAAGLVNTAGFFNVTSDQLIAQVNINPAAFSTLRALSQSQQGAVNDQIRAMMAAHQFYSDWAQRTLEFFKNPVLIP